MDHMIFDAHLHIIDPAYPLVSNEGYLPDPYTVDDYVGQTVELGTVSYTHLTLPTILLV